MHIDNASALILLKSIYHDTIYCEICYFYDVNNGFFN